MIKLRSKTGILAVALSSIVLGVAIGFFVGNQTAYSPAQSSGSHCGDDRQCFYDAYNNGCSDSAIITDRTTIEGDTIRTFASLTPGSETCEIHISKDNTKDRFGDGKVHTYTCSKLTKEGNSVLVAKGCTGDAGTHDVEI